MVDPPASGPVPKGLRFSSKAELIGYLATWLDRSSHDTIGRISRAAAVVQFPHPGGEHVPAGSAMPWNTADHSHARKFLADHGRFVDAGGELRSGDLVFWGEWEPPSRIVRRWRPQPGLPTVLHAPHWAVPGPAAQLHNTDPWVFGDAFLYSNCKQLTPARRSSGLQELVRGAVVLFGSKLDGDFVLDTVFVVDEVVGTYRPIERPEDLPVDAAFAACTLGVLATLDSEYATASFTLYRGATVDHPVSGMYSFVPCRERLVADTRFARPPIRLPGIVNPLSSHTPSGVDHPRPVDEVVATWHDVVGQVRSAGLDLGVHLDTPPRAS